MKIISNILSFVLCCSVSHVSYSNEYLWCKKNTTNQVYFDERDSEICEEIINYALLGKEELRESTVITIDTNENYDGRDHWIASFTFKDGQQHYYLYSIDKEDKFEELTLEKFQQYYQLITECNTTLTPLYSEN